MTKRQLVKSITSQVYKKYPEFEGVKPNVQENQIQQETYTFTFKTSIKTEDGKKIPRRVKVDVDLSGNILKIIESK